MEFIVAEPVPRVLVVGGGISGLSAAVRLIQQAGTTGQRVQVTICESGERWGGILETQVLEDGLVEHCADMFTTKLPWAYELCRVIGFEDQLIPTDESRRGALVASANGAVPVPAGFSLMVPRRWDTIWRTPLLSRFAKMRMWCEPYLARQRRHTLEDRESDESFASFAKRHWGQEAYERLIQPLVSGIFTADPEKLSMAAALSEFIDMEREHGSLKRAVQYQTAAQERRKTDADSVSDQAPQLQDMLAATVSYQEQQNVGVRYGLFLTPKNGMSSWTAALVSWLGRHNVDCRLQTSIQSLAQASHNATASHNETASHPGTASPGWTAEIVKADSRITSQETFDAVILAVPASRAAELLQPLDAKLSSKLTEIEYASAAIVVSRFAKNQFVGNIDALGFGLVVPNYLNSPLIAASFASQKFPGRCRDQDVLIRSFFGGALNPEHVDWSDERLIETSVHELNRWLPLTGKPSENQVVRWKQCMPQYHVGHRQKVQFILSRLDLLPGIALAGNAYHGVGIPQCVKSGWDAADKVLSVAGFLMPQPALDSDRESSR